MFKILTVGLLVLSSVSVQAMDGLDMALDISMKSIVKSKLWYEGISSDIEANTVSTQKFETLPKGASEELIVAVEKFEQF